jgi:hypothetical protein
VLPDRSLTANKFCIDCCENCPSVLSFLLHPDGPSLIPGSLPTARCKHSSASCCHALASTHRQTHVPHTPQITHSCAAAATHTCCLPRYRVSVWNGKTSPAPLLPIRSLLPQLLQAYAPVRVRSTPVQGCASPQESFKRDQLSVFSHVYMSCPDQPIANI